MGSDLSSHGKGGWLIAANDNEPVILDELPDSLSVTETELRLIETHFADIIAGLVAANDNED